MNRSLRTLLFVPIAGAMLVAPAAAQYAKQYTAPVVVRLGHASHSIVGSGTVEVKIQVNADGTHKVVGILKSTNRGDNAAAIDVAQTSVFKPALRGTKPVAAFKTIIIKFFGTALVNNLTTGSAVVNRVAEMNHHHDYADAQTKALAYLAENPGDKAMLEQLGVAQFFLNAYTDSAATFAKVRSLDPQVKDVAAHAFASASFKLADSDAPTALEYAKRAAALEPGPNAQFALGVAYDANKEYAQAAAAVEEARASAFADAKTAKSAKMNIDMRLMSIFIEMGDTAKAQAVGAQIKELDPSSTLPGRAIGSQFVRMGQAAVAQKQYPQALALFEKAAAQGDPQVSLAAYSSAASMLLSEPKPDFAQARSFTGKALKIKGDDPTATYFEGVALTGESFAFHRPDLMDRARRTLATALKLARASRNAALVTVIQSFMKNSLPPQ